MASAGDITVNLILAGASGFKVQIANASRSLNTLSGSMAAHTTQVRHTQRAHAETSIGVQHMARNFEMARLSVLALTGAMVFIPKLIIEQTSYFDKTKLLLTGLNIGTMSYAEATKEAEKQLSNLMTTAASSPYRLDAMADSFTKLKSANIDNSEGFLTGLVDTTAMFGKSSEELKRASIAIQQMAGKGVISMEELRQQFGEAVPNAMNMMARAANISMGDLAKRVSTGTVETKQALALLAREMVMSSAGSAAEMSRTWEGAVNRIVTSLQKLAVESKTTGIEFYQNTVSLADQFNQFLMSDEAIANARRLMLALDDLAQFTAKTAAFIYNHGKLITVALATMFAGGWASKLVGAVSGAFTSFKGEMSKWPPTVKMVEQQIEAQNLAHKSRMRQINYAYFSTANLQERAQLLYQGEMQKKAHARDIAALNDKISLLNSGHSRLRAITNSVVNIFGGWTNVIVMAIGAALYALDEFYFKQKRIADQMMKTRGLVGSWEDLDTTKKEMASTKDELASTQSDNGKTSALVGELASKLHLKDREVEILRQGGADAKKLIDEKGIGDDAHADMLNNLMAAANEKKSQADKITELTDKITKYGEATRAAEERLVQESKDTGATTAPMLMASDLKKVSGEYSAAITEAEKIATEKAKALSKKNGTNFDKEYAKLFPELSGSIRSDFVKKFEYVYTGQMALIKDKMAEVNKTISGQGTPATSAQKEELAALQGRLDKVTERYDEFSKTVKVKKELLDEYTKAVKNGSSGSDPLMGYIGGNAALEAKNDLLREELGLIDKNIAKGQYLARVEAEIAAGKYKGKDDKYLQRLRDEAAIKDERAAENKALNKIKSDRRDAMDRLDDLGISVAKKMGTATAKSDNPFMNWEKAALQTDEALKNIIDKFNEANGMTKENERDVAKIRAMQHITDQQNIRAQLEKNIHDIEISRLPTLARTRAEFDRQLEDLDELLKAENERVLNGRDLKDLSKEEADQIAANIELISRQKELILQQKREQTTIMGIFKRNVDEMADSVTTQLEGAFEGLFDAFASGIVDGKDSFKDMVDSMTKDLEKFFIKMAMMRAVESGMSAMGGLFGGSAPVSTVGANYGFANGGIMSSLGSLPLQKYAKGGIATSPQLALFGEGAHNEAYVPLPDGRSIPVTMQGGGGSNVQVNVINQSGVPMDAEQGNQRFDGEKYIVDVVVNALGRPGRMRTAVQGAR